MSDFKKRVKKWLEDTGYPLEMQVARTLQNTGFRVSQSQYWEDPDTEKMRETDVIATLEKTEWGEKPNLTDVIEASGQLILECKSSKNLPWVVFSRTSREGPLLQGFKLVRAIPRQCVHIPELMRTLAPFVRNESRSAYGVTTSCRQTNKDSAYSAMMSVAKSARYWIRQATSPAFAIPVIVIEAPLLEAYLDGTEIVVNELDMAAVLSGATGETTVVCVIRRTYLECFAKRAKELFTRVIDYHINLQLDDKANTPEDKSTG